MKQTAVEYFEFELKDKLGQIVINQNWKLLEDIIQKAKQMEMEQIKDAYQQGYNNAYFNNPLSKEQYYKETFKSEKQSYQDKMRDKITKAKSRLK
jgi:hypothetical protein